MFGALDVYKVIEDDSKISEVAIPNFSFFQEYEAMETLSTFLDQQ